MGKHALIHENRIAALVRVIARAGVDKLGNHKRGGTDT
jgi:hypothetical protein